MKSTDGDCVCVSACVEGGKTNQHNQPKNKQTKNHMPTTMDFGNKTKNLLDVSIEATHSVNSGCT